MLALCFILLLLPAFSTHKNTASNHLSVEGEAVLMLYAQFSFANAKPSQHAFEKAVLGYYSLLKKQAIKADAKLTLIDFSKPSDQVRMWILDMKTMVVLHETLVAHGKKSGDKFAKEFSNIPESHQSSLGFYKTGSTYFGKHGLSLRLHGLEEGINHLAEPRAIVLHGADYVSDDFIQKHGRLGRSFGCPAVPLEENKDIIELIKNGSCMYIYHPEPTYHAQSQIISPALDLFEFFRG